MPFSSFSSSYYYSVSIVSGKGAESKGIEGGTPLGTVETSDTERGG